MATKKFFVFTVVPDRMLRRKFVAAVDVREPHHVRKIQVALELALPQSLLDLSASLWFDNGRMTTVLIKSD